MTPLFIFSTILMTAFLLGFLWALFSEDFGTAVWCAVCASAFFFVSITVPTSSNYEIINDTSQYVEILPLKSGGLLIANLKNNSLLHEYDIRIIKAHKENKLFLKITTKFNILNRELDKTYSLEIRDQ